MGVYKKVHIEECHAATGKGPVSVRWIGHNTGDRERPLYMSRLVVQDFIDGTYETVFFCDSFLRCTAPTGIDCCDRT